MHRAGTLAPSDALADESLAPRVLTELRQANDAQGDLVRMFEQQRDAAAVIYTSVQSQSSDGATGAADR